MWTLKGWNRSQNDRLVAERMSINPAPSPCPRLKDVFMLPSNLSLPFLGNLFGQIYLLEKNSTISCLSTCARMGVRLNRNAHLFYAKIQFYAQLPLFYLSIYLFASHFCHRNLTSFNALKLFWLILGQRKTN